MLFFPQKPLIKTQIVYMKYISYLEILNIVVRNCYTCLLYTSEQYTRNMITGGSTANLAIILVDARMGVITQTRRHTFLVSLLDVYKRQGIRWYQLENL